MKLLRSAVRLVVCLPFLSVACVLDRSATATDCTEGPPCRLQKLNENTPDDAPDAAVEEPAVGDGDAQQTSQTDAGQLSETDASYVDAGVTEPVRSPSDAMVAAAPSKLPKPTGSCPEFAEGTATFAGSSVRLWLGSDGESKRGPLIFYWHASDSDAQEVSEGLGEAAIAEIKQLGGMVAAVEQSTHEGTSTGTSTWSAGDYAIADQVLACAIEKGVGIDTSRIHAVGFGAGGLHSSWMAYARSSYIASVVVYSGGLTSSWRTSSVTEDASNVVPAMLVHGKLGIDRYIYDYSLTSAALASDIADKGGFVLDCEHNLGHVIPAGIGAPALRFMKDHPYKQSPSPYRAALPVGFPSYCELP